MVVDNLDLCPNRAKHRELLEHIDEMVDLYINHTLTLRTIGLKFGTDKGTIKRLLVSRGIRIRGSREKLYHLICQDCADDFSSKCPTRLRCESCDMIERRRQARERYRRASGAIVRKNVCVRCSERLETTRVNRQYCIKCKRIRQYENKSRAWKLKPEHYRAKSIEHQQNRRARKHGATSTHLDRQFLDVLKLECDCCVYCYSNEKLTIDHIVPLSRGGTNEMNNLVLACKSCNSAKHNKYLLNFLWYRRKSLGDK